jgi:hypothetical protein
MFDVANRRVLDDQLRDACLTGAVGYPPVIKHPTLTPRIPVKGLDSTRPRRRLDP